MFIKILLGYFLGYLKISVEGYYIERFINICKNNKITNTQAFIHGAYLPDVAEDKITSHFGIKKNY